MSGNVGTCSYIYSDRKEDLYTRIKLGPKSALNGSGSGINKICPYVWLKKRLPLNISTGQSKGSSMHVNE